MPHYSIYKALKIYKFLVDQLLINSSDLNCLEILETEILCLLNYGDYNICHQVYKILPMFHPWVCRRQKQIRATIHYSTTHIHYTYYIYTIQYTYYKILYHICNICYSSSLPPSISVGFHEVSTILQSSEKNPLPRTHTRTSYKF